MSEISFPVPAWLAERRMSVGEHLYLVALAAFVAYAWLGGTTFAAVFSFQTIVVQRTLEVIAALCLVAKLWLGHYTRRQILVALAIGIPLLVSALACGDHTLIWGFVFVVAARDVDMGVMAFAALMSVLAIGIITLTCCLAGIIPNVVLDDRASALFDRAAWGFTHPNRFAFFVLCVCIYSVVVRRHRYGVVAFVVIVAIAALVSMMTSSRSALIGFGLLAVLMVAYRLCNPRGQVTRDTRRRSRVVVCVIAVCVVAAAAVSIWLMINYDGVGNKTLAQIDKLLSNRMRLMHYYYEQYFVTPFGRTYTAGDRIGNFGDSWVAFLCDNAYAHLILRFGVIPCIIFLAGCAAMIVRDFRAGRFSISVMGLALFLLLGIVEATTLHFYDNIFLLGVWTLLYGQPDGDEAGGGALAHNRLYALLAGTAAPAKQ